MLNSTAHSNIGAYTTSKGLPVVRESVAKYLEKRDGIPANIDNIFLTNGASAGITYALKCLTSNSLFFLLNNEKYLPMTNRLSTRQSLFFQIT